MNWNNAAEFFAMGGHGYFVWMSYGAAALLMLAEPLLARARHRAALAAAAQQLDSETGDDR
jgi:heme exporter protein D